MLSNKVKKLREDKGLTQAELARRLNITRSSVNAWELGLSYPSIPLLIELAKFFNVSVDFLLGVNTEATINVSGLSEKEVAMLVDLANHFKWMGHF